MIGSEFKSIYTTTSDMLDTLDFPVMIKTIVMYNTDTVNPATVKISVSTPIGFIIYNETIPAGSTLVLPNIITINPDQNIIAETSAKVNIIISYIEDKGITLA